jgi:hypothetical protein
MSMICLDDVTVVFDGTNRLRWRSLPVATGADRCDAPLTLIGVWPDPATAAAMRLRVRLGWPTLVVLNPDDRPVLLPHHRVAAPADRPGLVELTVEAKPDGPDRQRQLEVIPMSWMSPRDRQRGKRFLDATHALRATFNRGMLPVIIEDDLLGSAEPLRFACVRGKLAIDQLERLIERIYRPSPRQASVFDSRSFLTDQAAQHVQDTVQRNRRTA